MVHLTYRKIYIDIISFLFLSLLCISPLPCLHFRPYRRPSALCRVFRNINSFITLFTYTFYSRRKIRLKTLKFFNISLKILFHLNPHLYIFSRPLFILIPSLTSYPSLPSVSALLFVWSYDTKVKSVEGDEDAPGVLVAAAAGSSPPTPPMTLVLL